MYTALRLIDDICQSRARKIFYEWKLMRLTTTVGRKLAVLLAHRFFKGWIRLSRMKHGLVVGILKLEKMLLTRGFETILAAKVKADEADRNALKFASALRSMQ